MNNDNKKTRRIVLDVNGEEIPYVFVPDYHYSNDEDCHTITFREDCEQFDKASPCDNGHLFYDQNGIPKYFVPASGEVYKIDNFLLS